MGISDNNGRWVRRERESVCVCVCVCVRVDQLVEGYHPGLITGVASRGWEMMASITQTVRSHAETRGLIKSVESTAVDT